MKLGQVLKGIRVVSMEGDLELELKGLAYDSRAIKPGFLFVALRGHNLDGHHFLLDVVQKGATALVAEEFNRSFEGVAKVLVPDSREALSRLAAQFYNRPFRDINLIGITGTNGKTTTSYLLESILFSAGARPGVIGTNNYRSPKKTHKAPMTTPESLDLMRLMREMADEGVTDVIMEVSSHALDQQRTRDCPFIVAIFTNLTRDHLDYHQTMEAYFKAKSLLFRGLGKRPGAKVATAVINKDDPKGETLASLTDGEVLFYGLAPGCDVRADSISSDRTGVRARLITPVGERMIRSSLIGEVNIYNILAASAAAISLDIDLSHVVAGIDRLGGVPGRLELVENERGLALVVDYAHTPDALLKTMKSLRPLAGGRLITVFGCGGDRDRGKRAEMGLVVGENSDVAFITSDNPRTEDPRSIVAQTEVGIQKTGLTRLQWPPGEGDIESGYFIEVDRRKAIHRAVSMANQEDLVLIAGKGHEDYQILGREKVRFDDREEAALAASSIGDL